MGDAGWNPTLSTGRQRNDSEPLWNETACMDLPSYFFLFGRPFRIPCDASHTE